MNQTWSCGCFAWSEHYNMGFEKCGSYPACAKGKEEVANQLEWEKKERVRDRQKKRDEMIRQRAIKKLTVAEKRVLGIKGEIR